MSARPPQPLSPLSANIVGAKHSYITKVSADANVDAYTTMGERATDDHTQDSGSIISDLNSLDGDDDFDKLMIQNARDEQRLKAALRGDIRPFSKARIHPRVDLTLEHLERNNAALGQSENRKKRSPGSSNGSTRSDPPYRPPAQWGRKGRVQRNWLRGINSDSDQQAGAQEDIIDHLVENATPRQSRSGKGTSVADLPLPSVEDSPLSHKGSFRGTPVSTRRQPAQPTDDSDEDPIDFTIDFNEASMIASTPYRPPRSRVLDDIREREIESLKIQALATNRLDKIRESSPEETRRPRPDSDVAAKNTGSEVVGSEYVTEGGNIPEARSRKRTNSWKTIGKSSAVTGEVGQQVTSSPITVYKKTVEIAGTTHPGDRNDTKRPTIHKREDSHELLRRLARVSSTPSPGRVNYIRPQTAPAKQSESYSPPTIGAEPFLPNPEKESKADNKTPSPPAEMSTAQSPETNVAKEQTDAKRIQRPSTAPETVMEREAIDVDVTPIPKEWTSSNAKTPKVMGAWIDTPAPRHASRPTDRSESSVDIPTSQIIRNRSPAKKKEPTSEDQERETEKEKEIERVRPKLPKSALEAIVEEAKSNGRTEYLHDSLGDSTIDSLEELIAPAGEDSEGTGLDDDTLQGLQLPTEPPRNEAERQRQQELTQLHRMNQRLRAARTNIRDASRGMKRVESRAEHIIDEDGQRVKIIYRDCPCAAHGHQNPWTIAWIAFKRLFRDPTVRRRAGLTWLSIGLISFFVWLIMELYACDKYCYKMYAEYMVGYGTNPDAPDFPFVIPTMLYRWTLKPFKSSWEPLWNIFVGIFSNVLNFFFTDESVGRTAATATARRMASKLILETHETLGPDFSMNDDEVVW